MHKKQTGRKFRFILFGLCSLLATLACMAVLVITVHNIDAGNTTDTEYETQSKTELSGDTAVLLDYLKKLTERTTENKFIKADIYTDVSVDDSSVIVNSGETDNALLVYAKNKMMGAVDGYYPEDIKGEFGRIYSSMPAVDLSAADIIESRFSVGEADENGNPVYNTDTGELIDADYYFITLTVKNTPAVAELFSLEQKQQVAENFKADIAKICKIQSCEINVASLNIYAKVNRLTDEIQYINFEKIYSVSADVSFTNELEIFGSKKIDFEYKVNERFEYRYAGISFAETSVTVAPGKEAALTVNAVIENDSDYKVTFTSSDTAVATVDEMGYVKGIKASCTPVTIKVTLEYLGEEFTDECTVIINDDKNPNG
ncbi:MAG: Ig-like domain-containing protein [Clostridia bacterium]|nr:Ig-like domain-containing protein [Clostridia bacterium]